MDRLADHFNITIVINWDGKQQVKHTKLLDGRVVSRGDPPQSYPKVFD